jgi:hypothetical protein
MNQNNNHILPNLKKKINLKLYPAIRYLNKA